MTDQSATRTYACPTPTCPGYNQRVSVEGQLVAGWVYSWPSLNCGGCGCEPRLISTSFPRRAPWKDAA